MSFFHNSYYIYVLCFVYFVYFVYFHLRPRQLLRSRSLLSRCSLIIIVALSSFVAALAPSTALRLGRSAPKPRSSFIVNIRDVHAHHSAPGLRRLRAEASALIKWSINKLLKMNHKKMKYWIISYKMCKIWNLCKLYIL